MNVCKVKTTQNMYMNRLKIYTFIERYSKDSKMCTLCDINVGKYVHSLRNKYRYDFCLICSYCLYKVSKESHIHIDQVVCNVTQTKTNYQ